VCVAVSPLADLTDLVVSERVAPESGGTSARQQFDEHVPTVRLKRNHLVRFPLDRRRLLSAETHRDDPVADGREPLDNGRRARRLRLVRVVDCDDQVGAGVDGLAQRLGQFVRADPVFGDGVVADCVERGVVEPEPRRCSPRVDVDESGGVGSTARVDV